MKKTILCIDDIKTNLFTIQSVIEDLADDLYDVVIAQSANDGLAILLKQRVDIILLDVMMPDIDGFEAAKIIKSNKKTKDIPIIFVTANKDSKTIENCFKVGGDDYISKPFNHTELLARLSFHLRLKEQTEQLKKEKAYVQNILNLQENIVLTTDIKSINNVNNAFLDFFNCKNLNDVRKKNECICDRFVEDDGYFSLSQLDDKTKWLDEIIRLSKNDNVLVKILKDSKEYIFNIKVTKFTDQYIITLTDITKISQQSLEYKYEASYDNLTKIYNRNMFNTLLKKKIDYFKDEKTTFVFIILDIDFFKNVNDTYGHLVGDDVLITIAKLIKQHIRDDDIFARWGGEEFVLSFDVSLEKGVEIANNLRIKIQEYKFDVVGSLTCSFGITEFRVGDTLESMIKRADLALYEAKDSGRNRVCQA